MDHATYALPHIKSESIYEFVVHANHGVPHTVVSILPDSLDNAGGGTAGRGRTLPGLANHLFYVSLLGSRTLDMWWALQYTLGGG